MDHKKTREPYQGDEDAKAETAGMTRADVALELSKRGLKKLADQGNAQASQEATRLLKEIDEVFDSSKVTYDDRRKELETEKRKALKEQQAQA